VSRLATRATAPRHIRRPRRPLSGLSRQRARETSNRPRVVRCGARLPLDPCGVAQSLARRGRSSFGAPDLRSNRGLRTPWKAAIRDNRRDPRLTSRSCPRGAPSSRYEGNTTSRRMPRRPMLSLLGPHVSEVAELAEAIARRIGLPEARLTCLRQVAELHDVGKMAIADAVLDKPGPLTDDEWQLVREHTIVGERIVSAAPALGDVARMVRATHERSTQPTCSSPRAVTGRPSAPMPARRCPRSRRTARRGGAARRSGPPGRPRAGR
jgi:HD domain